MDILESFAHYQSKFTKDKPLGWRNLGLLDLNLEEFAQILDRHPYIFCYTESLFLEYQMRQAQWAHDRMNFDITQFIDPKTRLVIVPIHKSASIVHQVAVAHMPNQDILNIQNLAPNYKVPPDIHSIHDDPKYREYLNVQQPILSWYLQDRL